MDRRKQASSETLQPVGGGMGGRGIQALELSLFWAAFQFQV